MYRAALKGYSGDVLPPIGLEWPSTGGWILHVFPLMWFYDGIHVDSFDKMPLWGLKIFHLKEKPLSSLLINVTAATKSVIAN